MKIIKITTEYITLDSLLKLSGTCQTGGEAKIRILSGEVLVDKEVELKRGKKIRPGNVVEIMGKTITVKYDGEQVKID